MPKAKRNVDREVAQCRGRLGALIRDGADPQAIELGRLALEAAAARAAVRKLRRLPDATRIELVGILAGGTDDAT